MKHLQKLQELIINLSDIKNLILKFNFIVKRYSKTLAKLYVKRNILDKESDIWFLDINTIYDYIEGEIDSNKAHDDMIKSKMYYNSFRNFDNVNCIGYINSEFNDYDYEGIGVTTDIVKGKVRIIKSLQQLDTLDKNDIFVTKTINNNLLFKLPKIRGIIISDKNISNSIKTTLRELKLPCIIIENCSKKVNDGDYIMMDGSTGRIKKIK